MKKAEKKKLAEDCIKRIDALGIVPKIDGNWVTFPNSKGMPLELLMETGRCGKELAELIRARAA